MRLKFGLSIPKAMYNIGPVLFKASLPNQSRPQESYFISGGSCRNGIHVLLVDPAKVTGKVPIDLEVLEEILGAPLVLNPGRSSR